MTSRTAIRFALVLLTVALVGLPLAAEPARSIFDIPFPFLAGGQPLPAGEYSVGFDAFHRVVLACRHASCGTAVLIANETDRPADAAKGALEFNKYGNLYVLRRVGPTGQATFRELVQSKREIELVKAHSDNQLAIVESPATETASRRKQSR